MPYIRNTLNVELSADLKELQLLVRATSSCCNFCYTYNFKIMLFVSYGSDGYYLTEQGELCADGGDYLG